MTLPKIETGYLMNFLVELLNTPSPTGYAEQAIALVEEELLTFQQAEQIIDEYVHFFNYERIQLKTGQTPYQLRCLSG